MGLCPLCPTDLLVLGDSLEEGPSAGLEQEARGGRFLSQLRSLSLSERKKAGLGRLNKGDPELALGRGGHTCSVKYQII